MESNISGEFVVDTDSHAGKSLIPTVSHLYHAFVPCTCIYIYNLQTLVEFGIWLLLLVAAGLQLIVMSGESGLETIALSDKAQEVLLNDHN